MASGGGGGAGGGAATLSSKQVGDLKKKKGSVMDLDSTSVVDLFTSIYGILGQEFYEVSKEERLLL